MERKWFTKSLAIILILSGLAAGQSLSLVILDFEARSGAIEEARVFTEHLRVELFQRECYTILALPDVNKGLEKAGYSGDSCATVPCLTEIGRLAGSQLVVGGTITKIDAAYSITVRMVDVEKGDIARTFIYHHDGDFVSLLSTGAEVVAERLTEPIGEKPQPTVTAPISDTTPTGQQLPISTRRSRRKPGGFGPALASCLLGPRVGLEMNEGIEEIHLSEWIALGGSLVAGSATGILVPIGNVIYTGTRAYMAYEMGGKNNGFEGALAAFCIGPRVGNELHYRKIRNKEWLLLIPCVNIYPLISIPLEAYHGKTMTEIEIAEGLRK
ncbi:MAG TPA: hypothetical protein ENN20_11555 [Candidatus Marinimicrobia bacterium]|nr:hypothetical protein [Candidatus Neomarinimicrobiota bacterium]